MRNGEAGYHNRTRHYTFRGAYGNTSLRFESAKRLLANHFVGEETILESGRYKRPPTSSAIVCRAKKTQSSDLGELLATEYLDGEKRLLVHFP